MLKEVGGMVQSKRVQGAGLARRLGRGLGARAAVEREPETGRGATAAAQRVAGHGLA